MLGVVPESLDARLMINAPHKDFWQEMSELQEAGWGLAMHGFHHVYTTRNGGMFPLNRQSEFAGLPFEQQDEMIRAGKKILRKNGIVTDFFMAPSHSYDMNTLRALEKNGFRRITDGFGTRPYNYQGLTFYPISYKRSRSLNSDREGTVTFVYHANTMDEEEFRDLSAMLRDRDVITYDELLREIPVRATHIHRIRERIMAEAKYRARTVLTLRK
jgi:predicted deacetylase